MNERIFILKENLQQREKQNFKKPNWNIDVITCKKPRNAEIVEFKNFWIKGWAIATTQNTTFTQ